MEKVAFFFFFLLEVFRLGAELEKESMRRVSVFACATSKNAGM